MRISKNPEERRNELLDAAEELFMIRGYNETAVSDIVKKISVAQGTFYYYFKSKEEIFVAIFKRRLEGIIESFNDKINNSPNNSIEKLKEFIRVDFEDKILNKNDALVKHLHEDQNTGLHQKVMLSSILNYKPILTKLIKQGIAEHIFQTDYPESMAEFLLINLKFGFDPSIFKLTEEEYAIKLEAMLNFIEKVLSLPPKTLDIKELLKPYLNNCN